MAYHAANDGKTVVYFSLESSEENIAKRIEHIIGKLGGIAFDKINIKFFTAGKATSKDFREHINALKEAGFLPQIIIVDYAALMSSADEESYFFHSIYVFKELEKLAKEFDLPILTASQAIDTDDTEVKYRIKNDSSTESLNKIFSIGRSKETNEVSIRILKNSTYGSRVGGSYKFNLDGLAIINGEEI